MQSKYINYADKSAQVSKCVFLSKGNREKAICAVLSMSIPAVSKLTFSMSLPRTNEGQCERWRMWGATGFPSCSASLRNRAGKGRDPWDGGTELRKELLCSHLNRDRCWWRREVGQTKDWETERGNRERARERAACIQYVYSFKYSMSQLTLQLPRLTSTLNSHTV